MLLPRPDTSLRPNVGYYTVDQRPICDSRYPNGEPVMTTKLGQTHAAEIDTRPRERLETEQGPIHMPFGNFADTSFLPTTRTLERVFALDSRMTAISDRYYR